MVGRKGIEFVDDNGENGGERPREVVESPREK